MGKFVHKYIDTTLSYARLYDGTVAADYYQAISQVERQLALTDAPTHLTTPAQLLTLVDSFQEGTLNEKQREAAQTLKAALLALTESSEP